jgi:hypothetical protein
MCGSLENVHRHHDNYDSPDDVIYLCAFCHARLHSAQRRESDAA